MNDEKGQCLIYNAEFVRARPSGEIHLSIYHHSTENLTDSGYGLSEM